MTAFSSVACDDDAKTVYSPAQLSLLDLDKIPRHVAIIMDGNRRWAKQKNMPPLMGHWEGAEVLTDIVRGASELGIKAVTVFAFSTENWIRQGVEVDALMNLFEIYLTRKREMMVSEGIRLNAIGDLARLPQQVQQAFHQTRQATQHCEKIDLILALNYGGRDEIRRAAMSLLKESREHGYGEAELTEAAFAKHLDTARWPDPELLIRTSGEMRISNFLLWQISYAEIYVTDVLWPDFSSKELFHAVQSYQDRRRRLGG